MINEITSTASEHREVFLNRCARHTSVCGLFLGVPPNLKISLKVYLQDQLSVPQAQKG